jgi:hypothetical protein
MLLFTLTWTPSHPERTKSQHTWTANEWGIHHADRIASMTDDSHAIPQGRTFYCNSDDLDAAVTPAGTWQWCTKNVPFHGSLRHCAQFFQYRQYTKQRDMKRIYAYAPTRWSKYSAPLMAKLTTTKCRSPRQVGRYTKHLCDWMAHAVNLAKGPPPRCAQHSRNVPSALNLKHINADCTHPPLVEIRRIHRRRINEFL